MKRSITRRIKKLSRLEYFIRKIRQYSYLESFTIITAFLIIGYIVNPHDICLTQEKIPYLLILLSILTLFHGFESAFIAMTLISLSMWQFYDKFPYISFLVYLMMVLIFSQFHYYWTKRIHELQIDDDYKASKLDELSKAFYSLKISHDQLEKNYVLKPMSIRSAIETIILNRDKNNMQYLDFLVLLEKSFSLQSGFIIHKIDHQLQKTLAPENSLISYTKSYEQDTDEAALFDDYIITQALSRKKPVFVSDAAHNPTLETTQESRYLAAIPTVYNNEVLSLLVIEKMPFMAFNKENLISIAILLEYLSIEIYKENIMQQSEKIAAIFSERSFLYEYNRLQHLQKQYRVDSTLLILKIDNELQTRRVFEKTQNLLRSLDIVTQTKDKEIYYLVILFPLNDQAVALGFLNRLLYNLKHEKDKKFEYMTFSIKEEKLIYQYITDDYHG
ncbi:PelD GGDEF domain-containing protein [Sulfurimonas paralvinellae]|uniref:PelD GGDEF domain-containing protein n=1 Tax=Sulfurimonas paralvinellae TaxID=317658 RepID=A0A7M1B5A2_9BACT|nr:PelD GGDEF domain-containing protein [Sulfurimonas paralvinellae]QOP44917.1 hypothetical protein FM071_00840 [Sulfurimonas paralvinellae]